MANPDDLKRLREGVQAWNDWRGDNLDVAVDLSGAELSGVDLTSIDLRGANLSGAVLQGVGMGGADLRHASGPAQSSLFSYVHRLATAGRLRFPSGPEGDLLAYQLERFRVDTSTAVPTFSGGKGKRGDDAVYALGWAAEKAREQCDAGEDDEDEGEVVTMLDLLPGMTVETLGAARL